MIDLLGYTGRTEAYNVATPILRYSCLLGPQLHQLIDNAVGHSRYLRN
jgi:hypothetical protein